jgi:hypothetical protein
VPRGITPIGTALVLLKCERNPAETEENRNMTYQFDRAAFEDSVLNSGDDYEPYGFIIPYHAARGVAISPASSEGRLGAHVPVIDGSFLDDFDSVGC